MNTGEEESALMKAVGLKAAEWIVRRDRGLTAAEQDEFLHWLASDPRHRECLARQRDIWNGLNLLAQWRPEHSAEPNPDLLARRLRRPRWVWAGLLAAAAAAALVLTLWRSPSPAPDLSPAASIISAVDGYESRVLDDGSIVSLNRGAAVEVRFTPGERQVRLLRGEAHFKVAKNPQRPFLVDAAGVDVRAVGTAFDVSLGEQAVEVLVTEGRVQVKRSSSLAAEPVPVIPLLVAGQRAMVSLEASAPAPRITQVSAAEVSRLLGWQPQLLDFSSTPLAQVVAEFNRHNRVQMAIGDPALGAVPIVASFRSDNVDGFVRLLELSAGVRAERSGDTITLWRAR